VIEDRLGATGVLLGETVTCTVPGYARGRMVAGGPDLVARLKRPQRRLEAPRLAIAAWVNRRGDQRPVQSVGGWLPL